MGRKTGGANKSANKLFGRDVIVDAVTVCPPRPVVTDAATPDSREPGHAYPVRTTRAASVTLRSILGDSFKPEQTADAEVVE